MILKQQDFKQLNNGGMILAIAMNIENVQYSNAKDVKDTVFSVAGILII